MNLSERQIAEYRLEVLRERNHIEADIAQSLRRILMLMEACIQNSPWALQIMTGVYAREFERKPPENQKPSAG